jgi:hypothetical protein
VFCGARSAGCPGQSPPPDAPPGPAQPGLPDAAHDGHPGEAPPGHPETPGGGWSAEIVEQQIELAAIKATIEVAMKYEGGWRVAEQLAPDRRGLTLKLEELKVAALEPMCGPVKPPDPWRDPRPGEGR